MDLLFYAVAGIVGAILAALGISSQAKKQTKTKQEQLEKARNEILGKTERIRLLDSDKIGLQKKINDLEEISIISFSMIT